MSSLKSAAEMSAPVYGFMQIIFKEFVRKAHDVKFYNHLGKELNRSGTGWDAHFKICRECRNFGQAVNARLSEFLR